jgi:hypothetical protein
MTAALKVVTSESELFFSSDGKKLYTINIYNTDDALTQGKWAEFQKDVRIIVANEETVIIHGNWYTSPNLNYQAMSISFNLNGHFPEMAARTIKGCLSGLHEEYPGCTIQWTEASVSYL